MMPGPIWRTRIAAIVAAVVAMWVGSNVAYQDLALPAILVGALALLVATVVQPAPLDTLLLGVVVFGYVVGNRGFAQLSLAGNIPLLPAEFVLLVSGAVMVVRSTQRKEFPVHRDLLNAAILLWILLSSARLYADFRSYGVMALRDYATVYYAAFFFLGQHAASDEKGRRFVERSLFIATGLLVLVYPLFVQFPDFFINVLTIRGVPIVFFKGDLAGTFLAVGSVLFFVRYDTRRSWWSLGMSLLLAAGTIMTNNRASMLGLVAATALLVLARRWRFAVIQAVAGCAAAFLILFAAYVRHDSWRETPLYGVYQRVVSLVDPQGHRTYDADTAADKGDNNQFRLTWWRTVLEDTVATNPVAGLGYGYDLAERFVQEYYLDPGEEFTTRSPHNVLITTFARTGLIGLAPFLAVMVIIGIRTVKTCRRNLEDGAFWLASCAIFVSACFGVVLEGPMGAVVFWTALGIANARFRKTPAASAAPAIASTLDTPASEPVASEPAQLQIPR